MELLPFAGLRKVAQGVDQGLKVIGHGWMVVGGVKNWHHTLPPGALRRNASVTKQKHNWGLTP
jgi:hypothetical protein